MKIVGNGSNEAGEVVPTLFTWANLITLLRFLFVPYFVWLLLAKHDLYQAFWILVLLGSTDWIDGYVARRFHQVSSWGQLLDPLADRIGLGTIAIALAVSGITSWWLIVLLAIPDTFIFLFGLFVLHGAPDLTVTYTGKVRTALLMIGIPLLVLAQAIAEHHDGSAWVRTPALLIVFCGVVGHWIAGMQYWKQSLHTYHTQQRALKYASRMKAKV